ncbi:hypothetical protein HJFPF1_09669 [Paramyrothecium foliicola]|nr:hypothetical protein HJFPF1_09669 [Paramyrothecium foliicola]
MATDTMAPVEQSGSFDLESQVPAGHGIEMSAFDRSLDALHPVEPSITPPPPSKTEITKRRIVSIATSIGLVYTAGLPFTPLSWMIEYYSKNLRIVEYAVSHFVLAAACYFSFCIASLSEPMLITWPHRGKHRMSIQNGRIQRVSSPVKWYPRYQLIKSGLEIGLIIIAQLALPNPIIGRLSTVAIICNDWIYIWFAAEDPDEDVRWKDSPIAQSIMKLAIEGVRGLLR